MSGQGPYTGQKIWFMRFHPEQVPSAIERYAKEVKRIVGVLELQLTRAKTAYLVGEEVSYADLMFVPWFLALDRTLPEGTNLEAEFPKFAEWWGRVSGRESVKKAIETRENAMKA